MTIFFDKGLTRNPEIGNTPILSVAQYLETGSSCEYEIWHERL